MDEEEVSSSVAKYRGYVILCSVISLIIGGVTGYFTPRPQKPSAPVVISTISPTSLPAPTPTPSPIRIYVSGAVQQAAVYELPPESIVQDALNAAGGATSDADIESINLALELQDQQQIHVPRQGEASPPPSVSGGTSESGATQEMININTATAGELGKLPRVGPVTAQHIIDHRATNGSFKTIDDIQDVSGIGPATFEGFQEMITVGP